MSDPSPVSNRLVDTVITTHWPSGTQIAAGASNFEQAISRRSYTQDQLDELAKLNPIGEREKWKYYNNINDTIGNRDVFQNILSTIRKSADTKIPPDPGNSASVSDRPPGHSSSEEEKKTEEETDPFSIINTIASSMVLDIHDILKENCRASNKTLQDSRDGEKLCRAWIYSGSSLEHCKLKQCSRTIKDTQTYCWQHSDGSQLRPTDFNKKDKHNDDVVIAVSLKEQLEEWADLLREARQTLENQQLAKLEKVVEALCRILKDCGQKLNDSENNSEVIEQENTEAQQMLKALIKKMRANMNNTNTSSGIGDVIQTLQDCVGEYKIIKEKI